MHSRPHFYYVYIMTNRSKTLCTGRHRLPGERVFEHKQGIRGEFAARYSIDRLVFFERFGEVHAAIARGKQIKGLLRIKKLRLIVSMNPDWKDLSEACTSGIDMSRKCIDLVRSLSQSESLPSSG